ncbi:CaiB/BaiF CoA-transferase family protein [Micromonospora sp. NPDC023814]|uniref:CaiB/BaiF CoA transferase family protein n=1 Tax=Micromonospora sp. NPDC023814 TaxID=3154596 RepID=UPI0033CF819B
MSSRGRGPLAGIRVIELGGIGPGPFAGMMLADMGADVVRVDRAGHVGVAAPHGSSHQVLDRGRRSLAVDLKHPAAADVVLNLVANADVLLEGFRPGVAERLGIGPDRALERNPRLVYGRMTGWGQQGPYARRAGHDINYIAVTGALEPIVGADGAPTAPLNMLGDFGGGGMLMAFGVVAALLHARRTGQGQVVDAAIVDGTALFTAMLHSMRAHGEWTEPRGGNLFDGAAPYYGVYRTADDRWISVGAIEPQFYAQLLDGLGLAEELAGVPQDDKAAWPRVRATFARRFAERTRPRWMETFAGSDACVAEVLSPAEAPGHEHMAARSVFVEHDGLTHPAPAPRFSQTPGAWPGPAPRCGEHTREVLGEAGLDRAAVDALVDAGVVRQA